MQESTVLKRLAARLDGERLKHSINVADKAEELAGQVNYPFADRARLAGLLHDYAKGLAAEEIKRCAGLSGWEIDEEELAMPHLLHAPAAAYLVRQELGIDDPDILEAVRYHTIGSPTMGLLALIIYIADYIEPGRDFPGVEAARREASRGLVPAIITITSSLISYQLEQGRLIHPNTVLLRNVFIRRSR